MNWLLNHKKEIVANEDADLMRLENKIFAINKKNLSIEERIMMKSSLMSSINSREVNLPVESFRLANAIRKLGSKVMMPSWGKAVTKERVMTYVEMSRGWNESVQGERKWSFSIYMAAFVLVAFSVSLISVLPINPNLAMAKTTVLSNVSGEVFVHRKNVVLKGQNELELRKGDQILTKGSAFATIKFFNNSVTRLNENSSVDLLLADSDYIDPSDSRIELYLKSGRLWSTVVNMSEDSSFEVKSAGLNAGANKKAVFDMEIKDDVTQVAVFNNVVKVRSSKTELPAKTVISGYSAVSSNDGERDIKVSKMMGKDVLAESSTWVALNLESDSELKNQLVAMKEEEVLEIDNEKQIDAEGVIIESVLKNEKALELNRRFTDAQSLLVAAQAKLVKGYREDAISDLKYFKSEVGKIKGEAQTLLIDDPQSMEFLFVQMNDEIDRQLNDLSSTLPGDRLYRAKEYLQEVELILAGDGVAKIEVELRQAGDILLEMEDLVAEGKANLVSTLLKRYQKRTEELVGVLESNVAIVGGNTVIPLIEKQAEQIKLLTVIENSLMNRDQRDLKGKVSAVRGEMLMKFMTALNGYGGEVPQTALLEVKDLYETYIADGSDEDGVDPLMKMVAVDNNQISFIKPGAEVSDDTGIVMITSVEASADVSEDLSDVKSGTIKVNSSVKWDIGTVNLFQDAGE